MTPATVAIDRAVLMDALRIVRGEEPRLFTFDEVAQVLAMTVYQHEARHEPALAELRRRLGFA